MRKLLIVLLLALIPVTAIAGNNKDALADELIVLSQMDKIVGQIKTQLEIINDSIVGQMTLPEGASEEAKKDLADFKKRLMAKSLEMMELNIFQKMIRDIYIEVYTEKELAGLIQFYKSPVGQSMIAKQPIVFKKSVELGQASMKKIVPEIKAMCEEFVATMNKKYPDMGKKQ